MSRLLFTIGHSNHTTERFLGLLRAHRVDVVVDLRSVPISRYAKHFNRDAIARRLPPEFRYAWMGDTLGGRPTSPDFYDRGGHVRYGPLSRVSQFQGGLEKIERNCDRYRIALMCAEADPRECHRHLFVARSLVDRGFPSDGIQHILRDGSTVSEASIPGQKPLLEDAWRSPLSVSPDRAPSRSSDA